MSPRFAKAIDPVFLYVINLLERIEQRDEPEPREEHLQIRSWLDRAEAQIGHSREWELARYAVVSWIDELLIFAEWNGNDWWSNNVLEIELFQTREASTRFFEHAREASALTNKDALEVFYVCVILGFCGIYRDDSLTTFHGGGGAQFLRDMGLPPSREAWAKQVKTALRLSQGRPKIAVNPEKGDMAPPLEEKFACISSWLMVSVLSAATFFVGWYLFFAGSAPTPQ